MLMVLDNSKQHLTTGAIAHLCGVSYRTVIRWIHDSRIEAYQLPGSRGDNRVLVADFLKFLTENQMPVPNRFRPVSRRALVVDDERLIASTIRRVLVREFFEVVVAPDGFVAGALAAKHTPTVMTIDPKMPGLGGIDVIRGIRKVPDLADTKILVVSAMPEEDLLATIEAGADDAMGKPFKNSELAARVIRLAES